MRADATKHSAQGQRQRSGGVEEPRSGQQLLLWACGWTWAPFPIPQLSLRSERALISTNRSGGSFVAGRLRFPWQECCGRSQRQTETSGPCFLSLETAEGWRRGCAFAPGTRCLRESL